VAGLQGVRARRLHARGEAVHHLPPPPDPNTHPPVATHNQPCQTQVGRLHVHPDWFNAGYIFPEGFKSRLLFRCVWVCVGVCARVCLSVCVGVCVCVLLRTALKRNLGLGVRP
jgi:hypothetical protein